MTVTTSLWRNRDFTLLWSGQLVSTLGTRITLLAFPLLVLAETDSPAKAGLVGFAQTLPYLLCYLPAGALVDSWNRKRVMLAADAGRAVALGSIAVALALDVLTLGQLVVVAFIEGALFVFFQLAEAAALPHVVPAAQLPAALAQNEARLQAAELAGQPLGGLLFGIGRLVPFAVDAVSYLVSFVTLIFVRPDLQTQRERTPIRLRADIAEGVRWLWRQRFLRGLVVMIGVTNLVYNALTLAMIVRLRELGASPGLIGLVLGLVGAVAMLGAVLAPALRRALPPMVVVIGSLWVWAAVFTALVLPTDPIVLGVVAAASGLLGPVFNVVVTSYRYALTPDRLQARAQSVGRLVAWGTIPVGTLAGGVLVQATGARPALAVIGAAMALTAAATTAVPTVRNPPVLADAVPR